MTTTNTPGPDAPEEPTNRPAPLDLVRAWFRRPYARHIVIIACIVALLILPIPFLAVWFTSQSGAPASSIMAEIQTTMIVLTIASIPLMAFTVAVLVYSLFGWKHVTGEEPPMQESPAIETNKFGVTLWIGVTSVLAAFLVAWGLIELAGITADSFGSTPANQQPHAKQAIDINVTGQQWLWSFEYPDQGGIRSDRMVVPVNTPLYFNVTSKDVVHSFWVVEMGVKIDANPGAITNTGFTPRKEGTFNIRCAELCGLHHAYMETQIDVVSQQEFDSWVREMGGGKTL